MSNFDWQKFFKRVFWVIIAGAAGIMTQVAAVGGEDGFDFGDVEWTPAFGLMFLWGAVRAGIGWWNANRPPFAAGKNILLIPLLFSIGLTGCVSTPWSANPLKTRALMEVKEVTPDGGKFGLLVKDDGDGTFSNGFLYEAETVNPDGSIDRWKMTLNKNHEISSPALTSSFETFNTAVAQIPVLVDMFGPAPTEEGERQSWIMQILGFAGQNRWIFDTLIGLIGG